MLAAIYFLLVLKNNSFINQCFGPKGLYTPRHHISAIQKKYKLSREYTRMHAGARMLKWSNWISGKTRRTSDFAVEPQQAVYA